MPSAPGPPALISLSGTLCLRKSVCQPSLLKLPRSLSGGRGEAGAATPVAAAVGPCDATVAGELLAEHAARARAPRTRAAQPLSGQRDIPFICSLPVACHITWRTRA